MLRNPHGWIETRPNRYPSQLFTGLTEPGITGLVASIVREAPLSRLSDRTVQFLLQACSQRSVSQQRVLAWSQSLRTSGFPGFGKLYVTSSPLVRMPPSAEKVAAVRHSYALSLPIDDFETFFSGMPSASRRVWLGDHVQLRPNPNPRHPRLFYGTSSYQIQMGALQDLEAASRIWKAPLVRLLVGTRGPNLKTLLSGVVIDPSPVAVHDHHYIDMALFPSLASPAYITYLRTMRYFLFLHCVMKFRLTASRGDKDFLTTVLPTMVTSMDQL